MVGFRIKAPTIAPLLELACNYTNTANIQNVDEMLVCTGAEPVDGGFALTFLIKNNPSWQYTFRNKETGEIESRMIYMCVPVDWTPLGERIEL